MCRPFEPLPFGAHDSLRIYATRRGKLTNPQPSEDASRLVSVVPPEGISSYDDYDGCHPPKYLLLEIHASQLSCH